MKCEKNECEQKKESVCLKCTDCVCVCVYVKDKMMPAYTMEAQICEIRQHHRRYDDDDDDDGKRMITNWTVITTII